MLITRRTEGAGRLVQHPRSFWLGVLAISVASVTLRMLVPPLVYADAFYDDLLFATNASHLLHGQWLGPFDPNVTLAKGIGYPAFVAASAAVGLPFLVAQQLLQLVASALAAWVAFRLTRSRILALALYTALALDPSFDGTAASRLIRDNWYASVSLLLFAMIARGLAQDVRPGVAGSRRLALRPLGASALVGLLCAAYWLGREERPWLLPSLALLLVGRLLVARRSGRDSRRSITRKIVAKRVGGAFMASATFLVTVGGVALHNERTYGVFLTNDITEGQFAQAFGQWQAVRSGPLEQYVPITREMRQAVYRVSPAARELQPHLEGDIGAGWTNPGCQYMHICHDIAGGWMQWALRNTLAATGKYSTAGATQAFWRRLSAEISDACHRKQLTCKAVTPFLLPQPDTINLTAWARSAQHAAAWIVGFHIGDQPPSPSYGTPEHWATFAQVAIGLPGSPATELAREASFAPHRADAAILDGLYRLFSLPVLVVASLGYILAARRRRSGWLPPFLFGGAAVVAVTSRTALISLVDATSFPASRTTYMLPASGFLILAAAIGVWLLLHAVGLIGQPPQTTPQPARLRADEETAMLAEPMTGQPELTVVLPCLNEAQTLETCIRKASDGLRALNVDFEILVADNGSTDGSQAIARRMGARVANIPIKGYGAALRGGIAAARGRYVLMADADDSYALEDMAPFLTALRQGADLVVGNRFLGGIAPGAMPLLHRYLGNPVLSLVGRAFFKIPVKDFHCGMRAFDREKALALRLRSEGMEFASEMIVKFALTHHEIVEVPTTLRPDGRDRPPHLRSWRDGWRHLRFLLLFSPRWLFLYPGVLLTTVSASLILRLSLGPVAVGPAVLDSQSLLFAGGGLVIGVQAILFAILSRTYAAARGILPASPRLFGASHPFALERGLALGALMLVLGVAGSSTAVITWSQHGFGPLRLAASLRLAIPAVTVLVLGAEILMASFFLGLLQLDQDISAPATSDAELLVTAIPTLVRTQETA